MLKKPAIPVLLRQPTRAPKFAVTVAKCVQTVFVSMIHLNVPVVKHVTASVLMMILNADPVLASTAPVTARPASAVMIVLK